MFAPQGDPQSLSRRLRLPVVVVNKPFNLDESVFLVGAMTLAQDAIYWESVDGCTSGPLNFYIITFFCEVFNQPYDYISARIIGIILILGSILFYFLAIRTFFSTSIASTTRCVMTMTRFLCVSSVEYSVVCLLWLLPRCC